MREWLRGGMHSSRIDAAELSVDAEGVKQIIRFALVVAFERWARFSITSISPLIVEQTHAAAEVVK